MPVELGYSQQRLDAAERRHRQAMQGVEARDIGGEGCCRRSIPKEHFWNAVKGHGVHPKDEGYWRDMERLCPWIVPTYRRKKFGVLEPTGPRLTTRFGRVKERLRWNAETRSMERVA